MIPARPPFLLLAALALATPTLAAAPEPLDPAALPDSWRERVEALAAPSALVVPFVETRELPLKKRPVVLEGAAILVRERGLSLAYSRRQTPLVILDDQGLLLRHADGREQTPPPEAAESLRLLRAVFTFDLPALAQTHSIAGEESPDGTWRLVLSRRPDTDAFHKEIELSGHAARLSRVRLVRSERQTVTIELGAPETRPGFTAEELARYFR